METQPKQNCGGSAVDFPGIALVLANPERKKQTTEIHGSHGLDERMSEPPHE
jgi:hypothetical protein